MNRRSNYREPLFQTQRGANRALMLVKGFAIFLLALAVSALVSIDEVEFPDDASQEP